MSLDQFLTLVRSGEVTIWVRRWPDPEFLQQQKHLNAELGMWHKLGRDRTFELVTCVNEHSVEIFELLANSDASICASPGKHWPRYRKEQRLIDGKQEDYDHCAACEDIRDDLSEGIAEQKGPGAAATILEFPGKDTQAT